MSSIQTEFERLLPRVEKPARYIGGEFNSIIKKPAEDMLRFAFCFPDTYEIGMSYTGLQLLYYIINSKEKLYCERVFSPSPDMAAEMEKAGLPLFTWETKTPVKECDVLGFTLQYELCYTNVLSCLKQSGIPFFAKDRGEADPIVIAGGPCAYNPEPFVDFMDAVLTGDGEEQLPEFLELARKRKLSGWSKAEFLEKASKIQGVYVPSFYEPVYDEDGRYLSHKKLNPNAPDRVLRAFLKDYANAPYPDKMLVPLIEVVHDRPAVEIFRGCTRGCRFCQAGMTYRPVREKPKDRVLELCKSQLKDSGHQEVSLLSLSSSDYSAFEPLAEELMAYCKPRQITVSLPSLRMDNFSFKLLDEMQGVRKSGLTFAAEAGTQRLRDVINKNITEKEILESVKKAAQMGWQSVKLYFMMGLPTESYEDLDGIVDLTGKILDTGRMNEARGRFNVSVSVSNFVPKPCTPFQYCAQNSAEEFEKKHLYLKDKFKRLKGVTYRYHGSYGSSLEAVFARGDRRLSKTLVTAFEKYGCCFDAWSESFNKEGWKKALAETGIDDNYFALNALETGSPEPWEIIDCGISSEYLVKEYKKALEAAVTQDCRLGCSGCGVNRFTDCPFGGVLKK